MQADLEQIASSPVISTQHLSLFCNKDTTPLPNDCTGAVDIIGGVWELIREITMNPLFQNNLCSYRPEHNVICTATNWIRTYPNSFDDPAKPWAVPQAPKAPTTAQPTKRPRGGKGKEREVQACPPPPPDAPVPPAQPFGKGSLRCMQPLPPIQAFTRMGPLPLVNRATCLLCG